MATSIGSSSPVASVFLTSGAAEAAVSRARKKVGSGFIRFGKCGDFQVEGNMVSLVKILRSRVSRNQTGRKSQRFFNVRNFIWRLGIDRLRSSCAGGKR